MPPESASWTYPQIATVVAQVPSHVVWSGCMSRGGELALLLGFNGPSGWSLDGEPIQQVLGVVTPEAVARHANGREPTFVHNFLALLDDEAAVARAVIPVERINGPVLLISGRDDLTWPSTYMADQVVARLRQHGFRHRVTHLAYDNAGHISYRPLRGRDDEGPSKGPSISRVPASLVSFPLLPASGCNRG